MKLHPETRTTPKLREEINALRANEAKQKDIVATVQRESRDCPQMAKP